MAIYLRWCMEHDLMSVEFIERYSEQYQAFLADIKQADLRSFIRDVLKGQLFGALFNEKGAAFAGYYYGESDSPYYPSDIDSYAVSVIGRSAITPRRSRTRRTCSSPLTRTTTRLWQR